MTPFSASISKMFAKVCAKKNRRGHSPIVSKFRLEELESRDVPTTYFVATTGSDSGAGDSAHPWLTIQHAANVVQAGDTVDVRAGNYQGFDIDHKSGTASARITFLAESGVTITSNNSVTGQDGINVESADYITIDGFTVTGATRAGIRVATNHDVTIQNNVCDHNGVWGIFTGFSDNLLIQNNVASRSVQQHGIYVSNSGDNPIIRGNIVWGNNDSGIQINADVTQGGDGIITGAVVEDNIIHDNGAGGGASLNLGGVQDSVIQNNLIYNSQRTGIALFQGNGAEGSMRDLVENNTVLVAANGWALDINTNSTDNTVRNNILYSAAAFPGAIAIDASSLSGLVSDYNLVENRFSTDDGNSVSQTLAQWQTATGQDMHSFTSTFTTAALSALFVDPTNGDYHLKAGSPAIDKGTTTGAPATDFEGTPRPSGAGVDIGFDEYAVATSTTHFQVSTQSSATAGGVFTITITALTSSNTTDTSYTGTVHFTSSDGQAVLPSNYTFTAGDAGTHTFTNAVTLKTAGSQSVVATDTVTGSVTGNASVSVSAATASTVQVSTPSNATAGSAFSVTLTAKDAFGNTATGYTGMVHFTSSDSQAVLPSNYTFTVGDAGIHTFTNAVTLKTAGSKTVVATDTVTGSVTGNASVSVSAAAASTVQVSAPSNATAGNAFSVTLTAKDAFGNTATGYTGTVHLTSSDSQAVLPANYTFTVGDAGVHTFTNAVTLKTTGSQSVVATDTVTGSITGNASVSVSAATHFQVSIPSNATAGTAFTITISALNASNTVDGTYLGTVHFTSSDGQALLPSDYTFTAGDTGTHTFTSAVTLKTAGSQSITATDTGSITGNATTTVGAATASTVQVSTPSNATAGSAFSVTLTAKDAFGNTATGYTGTVHLTSSDSQAVLPANYTFTVGDAGVHTFTNAVTLKTAGSKTVVATDTVTGSVTGNATTTVGAATASTVQVSAPSNATAGNAFSVTLTAKDAFGNTATGYTGTVHLTSSDSQAVLPSNYTFTVGDAGVHTFTNAVTLKTAGSKTVVATDTVTGSITGNATTTVGAATASTVQVSTPSNATAGSAFSVTLTAKDAFGNTATGYTGTVHLTSSDSQAVLPSNYTFTVGDAGVHTFTNAVTLKTAGSKTVVATDTVTGSVTGNATTTVGAATASTVQVSAPSNATAGNAFSVTLTAKDAFGNTATGYTGTVHLTSSDSQAVLPSDYTFVAGNAGIHTFTNAVTLKTTGSQSLVATDIVTGAITGNASVSVSVVMSPPPAPPAPPTPPVVPVTPAAPAQQTSVHRFAVGTAAGAIAVVRIYDSQTGTLLLQGTPFGAYTGGVKVATGDVNGDGYSDIVLMAGPGAQNGHIIILSGRDFSVLANYVVGYGGEMNLAVGDINGDGKADVVLSTATDFDYVAVLSGATQNVLAAYSVFGGLRLGVTLAVGDFDGDGKADIIAGTATKYGAAVVVNGLTGQREALFLLPIAVNGVNVAAGDVNGDGRADVILGFATEMPIVVVYDAASQRMVGGFSAYPGQSAGVRVSTINRNGHTDILTSFNAPIPIAAIYDGESFSLMGGYLAQTPGISDSPNGIYVG